MIEHLLKNRNAFTQFLFFFSSESAKSVAQFLTFLFLFEFRSNLNLMHKFHVLFFCFYGLRLHNNAKSIA